MFAFVFLGIYMATLATSQGVASMQNADALALKREQYMELVPNMNKEIERITNNQENPEMGSLVMYEDAARLLAVAQRFCIEQHGYNDHYMYASMCHMEVMEDRSWPPLV